MTQHENPEKQVQPVESKDRREQERYDNMRNVGIGFTIPMVMAASVIIGCVIGYYLDTWLGTAPWLFLLFLALGIAAAGRETMVLLRKMNNK